VIYLMFGKSWFGKDLQNKLDASFQEATQYLAQDEDVKARLEGESQAAGRQSAYIYNKAGYPVYQKTRTQYFRVGQELYKTLLQELNKAEHFIFLEYFIIDDGEMWQGILDILEEKARLGLDVRLIYDDWGCASTMPQEFQLSMQRRGIRCEIFNPLMPIASVLLNNRDHRKITVIDGSIAFTGGINLADEYINRKERFGYWKDTGIMLEGEAVWNFTVMFLQMWSVLAKEKVNYGKYRPHEWHQQEFEDDGFVQPYGDTPLDHETVGESVYLNIINRAKKYVYIFTPYLIIDNEMMTALCLAAKSGIDVRIVTPGIPDKKLVFLLTRSYYDTLLAAGVRIFEYKPGFLHAKSFVCDDRIATVGTINLDYRSLYLHFECGVWMYHSEAVMQIKEDALSILEECREVTEEDCRNKHALTRIGQSILRLFAPLL
jgi:cardiolipin synthase